VLRRWHRAAQVGLSFRSMPALFDKTKFEVRLLILFTALYRPCTGLVRASQALGHQRPHMGALWALTRGTLGTLRAGRSSKHEAKPAGDRRRVPAELVTCRRPWPTYLPPQVWIFGLAPHTNCPASHRMMKSANVHFEVCARLSRVRVFVCV
jgi:hypothetical protein